MVGKKIIPSEELALNPYLRLDNESIQLTLEQALQYLKGETFNIPTQRGYVLVNFQNEPLGWINHLGNRFNNMYPKEWRIRMKIN
jgi:NOL1/NOP2/fmu family ribosome biogenesis protein